MYKYHCNLREFLKGKTIEQFGLKERLKMASRVVEEVVKAHKSHIIHMDIKPSNVMLDSKMHPVLVDFGIGQVHRPELISLRHPFSPGPKPTDKLLL